MKVPSRTFFFLFFILSINVLGFVRDFNQDNSIIRLDDYPTIPSNAYVDSSLYYNLSNNFYFIGGDPGIDLNGWKRVYGNLSVKDNKMYINYSGYEQNILGTYGFIMFNESISSKISSINIKISDIISDYANQRGDIFFFVKEQGNNNMFNLTYCIQLGEFNNTFTGQYCYKNCTLSLGTNPITNRTTNLYIDVANQCSSNYAFLPTNPKWYGIALNTRNITLTLKKQVEIDYLYINTNTTNNSMPVSNNFNLQNNYCYNETMESLHLTPNITDQENDNILWYYYFNQNPIEKIIVDDFSNTGYNMLANGWDFNESTEWCNYSTTNGYLQLYKGCQNTGLIKWLINGTIEQPFKIYWESTVFQNTSVVYCLMNSLNQRVSCLRMTAENPSNAIGGKRTNFSYWNGVGYTQFYSSTYYGSFGLQFDVTNNINTICIWGSDNDNCEYEIDTQLYGTTNNNSGKFFLSPSYNFIWEQYEPSFVTLDNIELTPSGSIPWRSYTLGDQIIYTYEKQGQANLNILVTDDLNYPDYDKYSYPITIYGDCANQVIYNGTTAPVTDVIETTTDYIKAIPNGESMFNNAFYLILFVLFIGVFFASQSLELALFITGMSGLVGSYMLSTDIIQLISSASLIAFAVTVVLSRIFIRQA